MDFGLFFLMQRDESWSEAAVYDSDLAADAGGGGARLSLGLDRRAPFQRLRALPGTPRAGRIPRRPHDAPALGMGVSLLPLHHPVDLAEQLAVVDVVSGGRLDVGIGRGGTLQDYQTFQSDREDARARVEEGIEVLKRSWSGAPFDFAGPLPLRRGRARAAAARAAAASAALRGLQQRGQRAVGGAPGPAHAGVVLRAARGARAAAGPVSRHRARRRPLRGRDRRRWRIPRVGHARGSRGAEPRGGDARDRGALHELSAQDGGAALGPHRRLGAQLLRSHAAASSPVSGVSRRRLDASRHARRRAGGARALRRDHRHTPSAAADGAAGHPHPSGAALHADVRGGGGSPALLGDRSRRLRA